MAEEGAHWSFQLIDGITASAGLMAASIKSLELTLKHGDETIKGSHEAAQKHTESSFGKMKETFKSFQETAFFVTENIEKAWESVSEVFEKVSEGLEYVFDVSDFRRNALIGLDAMLSTGYQANDVLEKLEGWAKQSGLAKDTFTIFGKQLLGEGFKEGELKPLLAALSDVQGANLGKVEASQELLQMFGRIKDTDKVNERELAQFGNLGIKPDLIYAALAKQKHETFAQAKAEFAGGNLHGTDAINAILGAIHQGMDKGGPLGTEGKKWADGSIPAQLVKAKDAISGMFEVDTTKFAHAISYFTEKLDGPEAKNFAKSLGDSLDKVGDWLMKLDFDRVAEGVDWVADAFKSASDIAGELFVGIRAGWNDVAPAIDTMGDAIAAVFSSDGGGSDVKMFAQSVMDVVGAFVVLGEVVVFLVGALLRGFVLVVEGISWLVGELVTLGANLVEGLWTGIKTGWAELMSNWTGLVELLPASVKHILGIASPSKVFEGLGMNTMLGFTAGLETVDVQEHITRQIAAPTVAPMRANAMSLSDIGGGGGGARTVRLELTAPIHIDGSKDPVTTAEAMVGEMRRVFLPELATAFEQLEIEFGA